MKPPDTLSLFRTAGGYRRAVDLYNAYLAQITVPYKTRFVETPYGPTHVLLAGPVRGEPVMLLHGNSLFGPHLAQQINALAPDYRVIVPDTIGALGRSAPTRPGRRGPAYGEWAAGLLTALNVERAHVAGVSNGAWLIGKLAAVAPDRIASAVLISAAGFVRTDWRCSRL